MSDGRSAPLSYGCVGAIANELAKVRIVPPGANLRLSEIRHPRPRSCSRRSDALRAGAIWRVRCGRCARAIAAVHVTTQRRQGQQAAVECRRRRPHIRLQTPPAPSPGPPHPHLESVRDRISTEPPAGRGLPVTRAIYRLSRGFRRHSGARPRRRPALPAQRAAEGRAACVTPLAEPVWRRDPNFD